MTKVLPYQTGLNVVYNPQPLIAKKTAADLKPSLLLRMVALGQVLMTMARNNKQTEQQRAANLREKDLGAADELNAKQKQQAKILLAICCVTFAASMVSTATSLGGSKLLTNRNLPANYSGMSPADQGKAMQKAQELATQTASQISQGINGLSHSIESTSGVVQSAYNGDLDVIRTKKQLIESDLQQTQNAKDAENARIRESKDMVDGMAQKFAEISRAFQQAG
ncbi:MAG: hypothetical protein JHC93_01605 [Parachlamydiales bacterium]|nr:hypothetical protein [Parachlamydiales bacterium]